MPEEKIGQSDHKQSLQEEHQRNGRFPVIGVREKLIVIFLLVKVLPLVLLALIAWYALVSLGTILRTTAVVDSRNALTAMAVENIERLTTDTAQKVAEFLYQRDGNISALAKYCEHILRRNDEESRQKIEVFFESYSDGNVGWLRRHGDWRVSENGMAWEQIDPYIPPEDAQKRSNNMENEDTIDGASFNYRAPYGFGDNLANFVPVPFYDEIALIDTQGMQIAKYVSPHSTKKRFPFPKELLDISKPENTFVKAENYFDELRKLGKDDIYVSDVIGAYVPSRFIGMYTPDSIASKRIDAKIDELETEADGNITETSWKLRVLNAELRDEHAKFNSHQGLPIQQKIHAEIERRLGVGKEWEIEFKSLQQASEELRTLGFPELAEEILKIPFKPEEEAYAGAENPLGIQFEGIVRWAKPVLGDNDAIVGYITFALNHDHLLEMINHITPMPRRYTELSDAFGGNYAFIWDYRCRSIVHPRHHSICGYNPETGRPETPWLEKTLYDGLVAAGFGRADWQDYIATLENYIPWTGDPDSLAYQSRSKRPSPELTKLGLVGLDGRYLNTAPQCTGWMDLTRDGGSGSFYIVWSGLYKLTTAATIPYYTGQYSPAVQGNRRGFGFVAIGAGIDDFSRPANDMDVRLEKMANENVQDTTFHLIWTTALLSIVVVVIAIWMASYLSRKLQWLIDGITEFHRGKRNFRFTAVVQDEFGRLANSFNEMAENIVQSVHTPLVITDMDLNIIYVNDQCLQVMGHAKLEDVIGKSYEEKSIYRYGSEYCPVTALLGGKDKAKVLYLKQVDQFLQGNANYFIDKYGDKQGYIITSNDVTDISLKQIELERAKEAAELASRHKSLFLARMSHELRTPMNAMLGLNEITQSHLGGTSGLTDSLELRDFLAQLKGSSLHLLDLLNDILEASNLESGEVKLVEKQLDLRELLDDVVLRVKPLCSAKQVTFTTHFEGFASSGFIADGVRLRQVCVSLLDNAIKYTPDGGQVDFTVRQKAVQDGKALLSFAVRDTGSGISKEEMDKVFQPFEQGEAPTGTYTSGSGLGLTIARKTLELFGTKIIVQSEVGKGSEFSFDVWLQMDNCKVEDKVDFEGLKGRFAGQKALVVDDVRLNRIVLVNFLQEVGMTADQANDGKEGLEKFETSSANEYSIIFMDIQMPVMNGYESATAIRQLSREDAKTVPIITISANAFKEDIEKSLASGMNAHYAKPMQKEVLAEILMTFGTAKE